MNTNTNPLAAPAVRVKGIAIMLDGTVYVVPPLSLGALEQLQERIANFDGGVTDPKNIATAIDVVHAALKRNYPELERAKVGELVGLENMLELYGACMDVSGLRRKAIEEGKPAEEEPAPGEATPG